MLAKHEGKVRVKLTDLGLALIDSDRQFKLTTQGTTVGTIDYMSPEQARDSRSADVRSDIYSLGCTAYHMLAGKAPFAEGGLGERLLKHLNTEPVDIRKYSPTVSEEFWQILLKMLAKKPEDRYPTPAELLLDLKNTSAEKAGEGESTAVIDVPEESSQAEAKKRKRKRKPAPLVTPEQARAAAAFHQRAVQVIAEGGGDDYARQLLANGLRLDPANITYRQTLRDMTSTASTGMLGRLIGSLKNVLGVKSKLRSARASSDWRAVLEHGEEVLATQPEDVDTHLALAEAATNLQQYNLAIWLLEQGRLQAPQSVELMRAQARLHEARREWKLAIALWEMVAAKEPSDFEARQKINALEVQQHMASFEIAHGDQLA
jgi:hypothetical protein